MKELIWEGIKIPEGVRIKRIGDSIYVEGPKGIQKIRVAGSVSEKKWVQKMIQGVTIGYKGKLKIKGVGYKAENQDKGLIISLGYKNKRIMPKNDIVEYNISGNGTIIEGKSAQYSQLRQNLTKIVEIRSAAKDKYKGKGVVIN